MFLKGFIFIGTFYATERVKIHTMKNEHAIETHAYSGDGFCPLVIGSGWQVSQLNDRADLHGDAVCQVERHFGTDEVFVLVKGEATLIVGEERKDGLTVDALPMERGSTYNIRAGVWHTIVTSPGTQVMIVEKNGTHLTDVCCRALSVEEREALQKEL